jgi:DNA-binding MarR family transcriptional regulator
MTNGVSAGSSNEFVSSQIEIHERRGEALGEAGRIFGDPAWQILLELSSSQLDTAMSVSALAMRLKIAETGVSRFIKILGQHHLVRPSRQSGSFELTENSHRLLETLAQP